MYPDLQQSLVWTTCVPTTELQHVQNAAAGSICKVERSDHITPSLFNLHWLSIKHRIQFKILLLCYKALNGQARDYISELLKQKIPSRYSLKGHCHDHKAHVRSS